MTLAIRFVLDLFPEYLIDSFPVHFCHIVSHYLRNRPLVAANLSDNLLTVFLLHILSVPAVVHHMNIMSQEVNISLFGVSLVTDN